MLYSNRMNRKVTQRCTDCLQLQNKLKTYHGHIFNELLSTNAYLHMQQSNMSINLSKDLFLSFFLCCVFGPHQLL